MNLENGKIWCETNEVRDNVLRALECTDITWCGLDYLKPTEFTKLYIAPMALYIKNGKITQGRDKDYFSSVCLSEILPYDLPLLSTIQPGDIVKYRSGDILLVLSSGRGWMTYSFYERTNGHCGVSYYKNNYNEQLHNRFNSQCDIVAVYKASREGRNVHELYKSIFSKNGYIEDENIKWDWEEPKPVEKPVEVKEMTISDIEKLVGCKVKIVKEN